MGAAGGVGADQGASAAPVAFGQLGQGELGGGDVVGGGVAAGIARSQQSGHRFARTSRSVVDEHDQRVVSEGPRLRPGGKRWGRRPPARRGRVRPAARPRPTGSPRPVPPPGRGPTAPCPDRAPHVLFARSSTPQISRSRARSCGQSLPTAPRRPARSPRLRRPGHGQAGRTRNACSPGERFFPCNGQDPREVPSLLVSGALQCFDQGSDGITPGDTPLGRAPGRRRPGRRQSNVLVMVDPGGQGVAGSNPVVTTSIRAGRVPRTLKEALM